VATMAIIVAQFITTVIVVGVQCRPMHHYWDRNASGRCISIAAFFYGR
jgi:hypothetical protein